MPPKSSREAAKPFPAIAPTADHDATRHGVVALMLKLVAFGFAGGVGFVVDMLATETMINFGLGWLGARAIGIVVALFATYCLNRGLAFRAEASTGAKAVAAEGGRYAIVGFATSALNYAVFAAVHAALPGVSAIVAIAIGSATALVASYIGYSKFAFRG
jgi:putative flippase GtrA